MYYKIYFENPFYTMEAGILSAELYNDPIIQERLETLCNELGYEKMTECEVTDFTICEA